MNLVLAETLGAALLAIAGDPVAHPAEPGQGLDTVAGTLSFLAVSGPGKIYSLLPP